MTTIGLIHYGTAAFLPLLNEWLRRYKLSGCKLPVVVFGDQTVPMPADVAHVRFDPMAYPRIMRPDKAFDTKGSIIIQAIQRELGSLLIVDTDAFFVKDPTKLIETLPHEQLLMGADPIIRYIEGTDVRERNAGVLYFCESDCYARAALATQYQSTFLMLRELNNNAMLEQRAWTILSRRLSLQVLPPELNWSYLWGREDPKTLILHEHGPQKWRNIEGAFRTLEGSFDPVYVNAYRY